MLCARFSEFMLQLYWWKIHKIDTTVEQRLINNTKLQGISYLQAEFTNWHNQNPLFAGNPAQFFIFRTESSMRTGSLHVQVH